MRLVKKLADMQSNIRHFKSKQSKHGGMLPRVVLKNEWWFSYQA